MIYKISELIGKQAITLPDAGERGVILGVFFDKVLTKCKGFLLLSNDDENRYYINFNDFSALSGDAAMIRSASCLAEEFSVSLAESPINHPAFNQDGRALGIIRDIAMDGARVLSFVTDGKIEIPVGTLLARSESIVVFNDTGKPLKIKPPKKQKLTENIASGEAKSVAAKAEAPKSDSHSQGVQTRMIPFGRLRPNDADVGGAKVSDPFISKYSFLLGKRLQRSIYAEGGRLIGKENDLVTEKTIGLAKESGKLAAVALHSL